MKNRITTLHARRDSTAVGNEAGNVVLMIVRVRIAVTATVHRLRSR